MGAVAGTGLYFGNLAYIGARPQSISFTNPPASGTVGGSATLSASGGGSGNPVTLSVDASSAGVCTLSGRTVTYAAAGTCIIDANQAGNGTYAAAPQVQQTITITVTVTGKPQSISFTNVLVSGTVGGFAKLSATASSGLPVVFSVDPASAGVCTVSGSIVIYTAAGSCVIDANQAGNGTYAAAPQVQLAIAVSPPS